MKLVVMSDSHCNHDGFDVPNGDVLIHAGDALGRGSVLELAKFAAWFARQPHKHKIYVPGNHDCIFEEKQTLARDMMRDIAHVLIDEAIEIEGKKFYGTPWSPTFFDWSFMDSDNDKGLGSKFAMIPENLDVLISHSPPYGKLDFVRGFSVGSKMLRDKILQAQPKLVICGHIHEGAEQGVDGTDFLGQTQVVNASVLNGFYQWLRDPFVLEI